MLNYLKKEENGKYYYKGEKAEYYAECDEFGNAYLTVKNHEIIKDRTSLHLLLSGCEESIKRIENGINVLY